MAFTTNGFSIVKLGAMATKSVTAYPRTTVVASKEPQSLTSQRMIFVVLELALAFTGIDSPTLRMEQMELELCAYLVGRHLSSMLRLVPILLLSRTSGAMAKVEDHILGMNLCLHARYCRIAKSQGCTSYWMDTACIPDEHLLRNKSIANITRIFTNSKVTLVL
jgi:hypothetical protein